jgi:hypothetical protein
MTRLVLVVVNHNQTLKVTGRIALQGCGAAVSSRLFSYAADSKGLTAGPSEIASDAVVATLEPFSLAVIDIKLKK